MCRINQQTLIADGAAVGQALESLGTALNTTDPSLGKALTTAGEDVVKATMDWKTGSTLAEIEDAEQAAIVVLNSIPVTSNFAVLVAIAFAALNTLIANSQTQPDTPANPSGEVVSAHAMLAHAAAINTESPWKNKAKIEHSPFRTVRGDIEHAWNQEAVKVGVAQIKL